MVNEPQFTILTSHYQISNFKNESLTNWFLMSKEPSKSNPENDPDSKEEQKMEQAKDKKKDETKDEKKDDESDSDDDDDSKGSILIPLLKLFKA